MTTNGAPVGEKVKNVRFDEETLFVELADGRTLSVPVASFPRLHHASAMQRANWRPCGGGYGIHWPDLDEDLSTAGLLRWYAADRASA